MDKSEQSRKPDDEERLICLVSSGKVYLSKMQFLRGYCILQAEPEVPSINHLALDQQAAFFADMTCVGDAILEVTGAHRINYALLGNSMPILHAHIVPRYASEPAELKQALPWTNPAMDDPETVFKYARDKDLMDALKKKILVRAD
ncbi:MAG: hypothetical protein JEZ00_17980 [Anaerolineaceae bacterium]|nr:hypothetical protein [Anaerolineaceae bacterium]